MNLFNIFSITAGAVIVVVGCLGLFLRAWLARLIRSRFIDLQARGELENPRIPEPAIVLAFTAAVTCVGLLFLAVGLLA
jgi:hypothetical protein